MNAIVQHTSQIADHLRDNGLEALQCGVDALRDKPDARSLRVALREVGSGIELLLKGILAAEHWSLIFEQPGKASLKQFQQGDFKSAGFEECLQRIQSVLGIEIKQRQDTLLRRMRTMRNKFEHLGALDNLHAVNASIGGALHVIADLVKAAEAKQILGSRDLHQELSVTFAEVSSFVDARWKELKPRIARDDGDPCPACSQFAGVVRDGLDCLFCNTHSEPREAADAFLDLARGVDAKDGEWPRFGCLECEEEAMVDTGWDNPERYRCFACDARFDSAKVDVCSRCDSLFLVVDEGPAMCSECFSQMLSRDD